MQAAQDGGVALARRIADQRQDVARNLWIKAGDWLVSQNHFGVQHESAGNAHSLLLSTGQFSRAALEVLWRQPDAGQQCAGPGPMRWSEPAQHGASDGHLRQQTCKHVAGHAHAQGQVEMLMDHCHALAQFALCGGGQFSAVNDDPARARTRQAVDRAQQCRFAGSRRAKHDAELSSRHREADPG